MKTTARRNRRVAVLLAGLISLGVGFAGNALPAGADIDDITTCPVGVDCTPDEDPDGGIDDFENPTEDPDPDPDPQPEPELPPAEADDVVVADPTFTG